MVVSSVSLRSLIAARKIALRQRIWFKALTRIERVQVDLTIRVVQKIQSTVLKNILNDILKKIHRIVEPQLSDLEKGIGRFIARKLSLVAISWGHTTAGSWPQDKGFVQFLTINHIYKPKTLKV